jgi:hypothetical protein
MPYERDTIYYCQDLVLLVSPTVTLAQLRDNSNVWAFA